MIMNEKKFNLDINLDDETECREFIEKHGTTKGRRLANLLGLKGEGSTDLATALSCYAWNKFTAMNQRIAGNVSVAIKYETICDTIYTQDIQPVCECW